MTDAADPAEQAKADTSTGPDAGVDIGPHDLLKRETLAILLQLDALCAHHGLTYYLAEGTLLGAVRHQGFIPWDDDIDIAMPRADYEKLSGVLRRSNTWGLIIFNEHTHPQFHLTFSKVFSTKPSAFRTSILKGVPEKFRGPVVDVFPLDSGRAKSSPNVEFAIRWLRDALLFKVGFLPKARRLTQPGAYRASKWLGFRTLRASIKFLYRRHELLPGATTHLVNYASSYPTRKERFKSEWMGEPRRIPFEGHQLPVPQNWDMVLRTTYGGYMTMPPEAKRVYKHRRIYQGAQLKGRPE